MSLHKLPPCPNLEGLLGPEVVGLILRTLKGSLGALAGMDAKKFKHIGADDLKRLQGVLKQGPTGRAKAAAEMGHLANMLDEELLVLIQSNRLQHIHAGYIALSPVLTDIFGGVSVFVDGGDGVELNCVKKAMEALGSACVKAANVDVHGSHPDGSYAQDHLLPEVRSKIERAANRGKTDANHVDANDRPEVKAKGLAANNRGGKEMQRRKEKEKEADEGDGKSAVVAEVLRRHLLAGELGGVDCTQEEKEAMLLSKASIQAEIEQLWDRRLGKKRSREVASGLVLEVAPPADILLHKCRFIAGTIDFSNDDHYYKTFHSARL